eukprot:12564109-Alexandrium_andersonii.AAC.1
MVAVAYVTDKVLRVAEGHPWSLATGSIEDNLASLSNLEQPPTEQCAAKLYKLLRMGACPLTKHPFVSVCCRGWGHQSF